MTTTITVAVRTVGLDTRKKSELTLQLAQYPQIDLQHYAAWNFGLLHADVIVLGTDASVGQETLDMLREYAGVKQPSLVTVSENDERMRFLSVGGGEPAFERRLEQALHRAGCPGISMASAPLDPIGRGVERPSVEGPSAREGIHWTD